MSKSEDYSFVESPFVRMLLEHKSDIELVNNLIEMAMDGMVNCIDFKECKEAILIKMKSNYIENNPSNTI